MYHAINAMYVALTAAEQYIQCSPMLSRHGISVVADLPRRLFRYSQHR
jgi:hypothetical protein